MNKIVLEYTDTAELEAKREEALRQESNRYYNAYKPLELKFYQEFAKSKVEFHYIDLYGSNVSWNHKYGTFDFLSNYGPDGILYKISKKKTKKYSVEIYGSCGYAYIEPEAHEWCHAILDEDKKKVEKFLKRKTIKNILDEIKKVEDENVENISNIKKHYDAMIEKAQQIQKIGADYKDMNEFIIAIREEAKKLGYYAIMKNCSIEFHKDTGDNCYSRQITAYATLPYSKKKEGECIILTHELFEQVMQPLHDALKIDTSWEDKYEGLFYFNMMKTKVKVHVSDGNGRHWLNHVKEYSKNDFTEVNFKKWLKNVEINDKRHLTKDFLKKARSI